MVRNKYLDKNMRYPLAAPSWGGEEIQAIQDVIKTGQYSMNKKVEEFEKEFASMFDSKYAVMVNSGSSANLIMVAALFFMKEKSLKPGDEVIVPAVSWATTYTPLQQYGLHVKFVDIDLGSLNYDLEQLESAISEKTKVIFAVNLLGNPNDFKKINSLIEGKDIILIEDNCESMGAVLDNKKAGSYGLMGSFSCFHSHHIVTMEGGVVVTDNEELYHILLCLRSHGWTRNLPQDNLISKKGSDDFKERFRFILPGYNVRPIEMFGAIGLKQLEKLPGMIKIRRNNAEIFQDLFNNNKSFFMQQEIGNSSWFGFALMIKEGSEISREDIISALDVAQIDTRPVVAGNIANKEMISKYFDYSIYGKLKNADYVDSRGFYVGNHSVDIKDNIYYLRDVLKNKFGN